MSFKFETRSEQGLLRVSIVAIATLAVSSVAFGLYSGSHAIVFDGVYNLADAVLTLAALFTVRLIAKGEDERFQYGYWHLEPLLSLLGGLVLAGSCGYAFFEGLSGLTGHPGEGADLGAGALFAGGVTVFDFVLYWLVQRRARHLNSEFLRTDARGWLTGGILSASLFLSFGIGRLLEGTALAVYTPYVDPAVLMVAAICMLPFPLATLKTAMRDILQIAPQDLSAEARQVAQSVADRHGFEEATSHVQRVGRHRFVEINLLAPSPEKRMRFAELDAIRAEIAARLGKGIWLTVDFTADRRWVS